MRKLCESIDQFRFDLIINFKILRAVILPIYHFVNMFYFRYVDNFYSARFEKLTKKTQAFAIGRPDFGTHLYSLQYMRLWRHTRGDVSLFLFTKKAQRIKELTDVLLPNIPVVFPEGIFDRLIRILFGQFYAFNHTLLPLYFKMRCFRPDMIHLFDIAGSSYAHYNEYLDPALKEASSLAMNSNFIDAYKCIRKQWDYQWPVFIDFCALHYSTSLPKMDTQAALHQLRKNLGFCKPYVILNINVKQYNYAPGRRTINFPERYEPIIDSLIARGYDVILQGRQEQPKYAPRTGLFDYSKSNFCSMKNDVTLYNGCEFAILSKTGAETFATICNAPVLGLNYAELLGMQPSKKMRFYPKLMRRISDKKILSWQELLKLPNFFDMGAHVFGEPCEYIDMSVDEMMDALEEFIPLVQYSDDQWKTSYTSHQQSFKEKLTPLHMELFLTQAVPCDAYLKKYY